MATVEQLLRILLHEIKSEQRPGISTFYDIARFLFDDHFFSDWVSMLIKYGSHQLYGRLIELKNDPKFVPYLIKDERKIYKPMHNHLPLLLFSYGRNHLFDSC